MMIISSQRKPFEVTGRFVLVCFVAFFLAVAAINAIMIRFAVATFGGVETESAYKAGLAFKAESAAAVAQEARGWKVDTRIEQGGQGVVVFVSVHDAAGLVVPHLVAELGLAHPADKRRDLAMAVSETSPGVFRATAQGATGQRILVVELARNGERVFRSVDRIVVP
jgi:nitrogen fixation protein FixH